MRTRLNPWVVVLTAVLTFGSLMAFVGPRSFGYHHWGHWGRHGYYDWHGYGGHHDRHRYDDYDDPRSDRRSDQVPMKPDTTKFQ